MDEIGTCQFCLQVLGIPAQESGQHFIVCGGCGARGPRKPTQAEAIAAYNARPSSGKSEPAPSYAAKPRRRGLNLD